MNMVIKYVKIQLNKGKENPINQKGYRAMTTMYKCEKCGKIFSEYDECYTHENGHWILDRWTSMINETDLDTMTEYKEGQEEPNVVHLFFKRWNSEKCEYEGRCGKFKLVSSYDAPLVIENE